MWAPYPFSEALVQFTFLVSGEAAGKQQQTGALALAPPVHPVSLEAPSLP